LKEYPDYRAIIDKSIFDMTRRRNKKNPDEKIFQDAVVNLLKRIEKENNEAWAADVWWRYPL